jgi:tRNA threonylcarbamoyladenosine biosynthesis protein TsaB
LLNILGIDTSYNTASIAISQDEKILASITKSRNKIGHTPNLVAMIEGILESAGLKMEDIDAVAVSQGPGSFTGLRVGIALAKGLTMGAGKILVGIPTLDALAMGQRDTDCIICPVLDARKKEVYAGFYKKIVKDDFRHPLKKNNKDKIVFEEGENVLTRISDYMVISPKKLSELIVDDSEKIILFGIGVGVYKKVFEENIKKNMVEYEEGFSGIVTADNIALLGHKRIKSPDFKEEKNITPMYLRKSEAELSLEK